MAHDCIECGRETNAFFDPSLGWYCGDCKMRWEKERVSRLEAEQEEIAIRQMEDIPNTVEYGGDE